MKKDCCQRAGQPSDLAVPQGGRGSRRQRPVPKGAALQVRKISKRHLDLVDFVNAFPGIDVDAPRPRVRADCAGAERPCPRVACRYHRFLDVDDDRKGSHVKFPFPGVLDLETMRVEAMEGSCVLDLARDGYRSLEEVGELLNLTRERVRQIEESALRKLRADPATQELVQDLLAQRRIIGAYEAAGRGKR